MQYQYSSEVSLCIVKQIYSLVQNTVKMAETLEFTTVYDDVTVKFLENEFARLEGE